MICSKCGRDNNAGYSFCAACGAALGGIQTPKAPDDSDGWSFSPSARAERLIGRLVENKYRLDSILGTGGMGTVFCAMRVKLGDRVAIKILHPELTRDAEAAERFYREAQMAARVKHPNAINIFDVGVTDDDLHFIVMDFFDGDSLRQIIKRQDAPDLKFIATVAAQICSALDEAHRQGITHRDVKPDNVLVAQVFGRIQIKVLDFGIAKLLDKSASNLTMTGSVMGTPQYMSPEQCMGDELDHRADIYSVGVMLYEMLCGRVPFNAANPNTIAVQHVQKAPPPMLECSVVTPEIERVVMRALEKNPDRRQQTAGNLAYELDLAVSQSLGISTPITIDSVALKKAAIDLPKRAEAVPARATPAASAVADTNANQPTQVNRIAFESGRQTPFAFAPSGAQPKTARNIPVRAIAVTAAAMLILAGIGGGGWIFFGDSKKDGAAKNAGAANESKQNAAQAESKRETAASESGEETKEYNIKNSSPSAPPEAPPSMVYVSGGSFTMGGDRYVFDGKDFVSPPHEAAVKPFFMDAYEVTCENYKKFIDATNYQSPKGWSGNNFPVGKARFPVTDVDWDAANAYAKWAGKRLPTEAEWEFAARGTDGRLYSWGKDWEAGMANAEKVNWGMVAVGSYKGASPFGIYDMVGNAWEWTATTLEPYPNGTMPDIDAAKNIERKIIRGGSWESDRRSATATYRGFYGVREEPGGYKNTSFRCVKDAPEK